MCSTQKRISYTVHFELDVIKYAKEHGNRAAKRHCGPPLSEKMICEWRKLEEKLQQLGNYYYLISNFISLTSH
jgi:hypothetical protein